MQIAFMAMDDEGVLREVAEDALESQEPRVVAQHTRDDGSLVSKAFLPLCLRGEDRAPLCFETVVVRGHKSRVVAQHTDLHRALQAHDQIVGEAGTA